MTGWFTGGFDPPPPPSSSGVDWHLAPLGPEHNESDYAAWMGSFDHVAATPGFTAADWVGEGWPVRMSIDDNLSDLVGHRREFDNREAYAYTVLDHAGQVIGCVYVDPDRTGTADAQVRSWVVVALAALDATLAATVDRWLHEEWGMVTVRWPGRQMTSG